MIICLLSLPSIRPLNSGLSGACTQPFDSPVDS